MQCGRRTGRREARQLDLADNGERTRPLFLDEITSLQYRYYWYCCKKLNSHHIPRACRNYALTFGYASNLQQSVTTMTKVLYKETINK